MKHEIYIKYECPLCGYESYRTIKEMNPSFHNTICYRCSEIQNDIIYYTEPIEIEQFITSKFDEDVQYIPSKPHYVESSIKSLDMIQNSGNCNCCDSCNKKNEDGYCNCFEQCPTTCEKCTSSTHNKLKFLQKEHYCYDEYWNLSQSLAVFLIPRIRGLLDNHCGYPSDCKNDEEYVKILKSIIIFLRMVENDDFWFRYHLDSRYTKRQFIYKYGKAMLCKYIDNLWD
jgi:hypothetical protein